MKRTLLLNATYEPLAVVSWQRAVVLDFLNKIEIIETWEDEEIRTSVGNFKIPSVAKLKTYVRFHKYKTEKFCKKNVFVRDDFTCQYCGKKKNYDDLTFDHVIPKSSGGKTTWTNIVACCIPCNQWKGDNSPKEAGMTLLKEPVVPKQTFGIRKLPKNWKRYL